MDVLETHIDTASSEFKQNHELMEGLVGKLRDRVSTARKGGSEKSHQRHQEQGKLFVRDRLLGTTEQISDVRPVGANMSADGRFVAFDSGDIGGSVFASGLF